MKFDKMISKKSYLPALLFVLVLMISFWLKPDMKFLEILTLALWFLILAGGGELFQSFFKWHNTGRLKIYFLIPFSLLLLLLLWVVTLRINSLIVGPSGAWSNKLISFLIVAVYFLSNYKIRAIFSGKGTELIKMDNELIMKELELDFMRNQFNPHFLFNSLNNVAATIMVNRDLALDYTYKLAEMLRYQMGISGRDRVDIKEEEAFIRNYLDVEKLRLGDRCTIEFASEINANDIFIPPFLMHPLIEFSLRKSQGLKGKSSLAARLIADEKNITLNIKYSDPDIPAHTKNNEHGLALVSKRLKQFYPAKHRLEENNKNGIKEINLLIIL